MKTNRSTHPPILNNRGSAIITVVIAMLFVLALGTALLYAAYTGYQIAITERGDKETFYSCSTAMDDIRNGIQNSVTQALAVAYTKTLTEYAKADESYDPQYEFAEEFEYQLLLIKSNADESLFESSTSLGITSISAYYPSRLMSYTDNSSGAVTLGYKDDYTAATGAIVLTKDSAGKLVSITMKAISVKYVDISKGYESQISTDITINVPIFYAKTPIEENLNDCAIISEGSLIQTAGGSDTVINGDTYVGGIFVSGSGNKLTFEDSNVICKGTLFVSNSGSFEYNSPKYELWSNEIAVGSAAQGGDSATTGNAILNGKVYVADDLVMEGNNGTSITLQGSYFGFGNGGDDNTPEKSSAIIVNGRGSALDISKLSSLSLAGVSFINIVGQEFETDDSYSYSNPIPMGESISVKSNQLAYLVPDECINNYPSNPYLFEGTVFAPKYDLNTVLWGTKTLGDYLGTDKGEIKTLYKNIDSIERIAYVFMVFSSQEYANAYFRDYFAAHPEKIGQYLSVYLDLSDKSSTAYFDTAGNTFYMANEGGTETLTLMPAHDAVWADGLQSRFSNISSPFGDFVLEDSLYSLPANTELNFVRAGETVAVITNKDYDYNSTAATASSSLKIIISTKNIKVSSPFNGMILTKGNLTVSTSITATMFESDILSTTCENSGITYKLSDFVSGSFSSGGSETGSSESNWNLDDLVVYENWAKN